MRITSPSVPVIVAIIALCCVNTGCKLNQGGKWYNPTAYRFHNPFSKSGSETDEYGMYAHDPVSPRDGVSPEIDVPPGNYGRSASTTTPPASLAGTSTRQPNGQQVALANQPQYSNPSGVQPVSADYPASRGAAAAPNQYPQNTLPQNGYPNPQQYPPASYQVPQQPVNNQYANPNPQGSGQPYNPYDTGHNQYSTPQNHVPQNPPAQDNYEFSPGASGYNY
ncbi:MAG: hypothetical protein ACRC2T_10420 [Thermoguttaceae bacterium]